MKFLSPYCIAILIAFASQSLHAQTDSKPADSVLEDAIKIYIDCSTCDNDYIRREISFVNFVRDRNQADVHILVSRQMNGSGGDEYMVEFIGNQAFSGMTDTLIFNTKQSETDDKIRAEVVKYFKLGLTRFAAKTNLSEHLDIKFTKPTSNTKVKDKWNYWVFEIDGNMWINGDENYRSVSIGNEYEASRVTEALKVGFGLWWNYNDQKFNEDDGYDLYTNRSKGTWGHFVFSLNDKWSAAYEYNFFTSTFSNKDFDFSTETGIEYNIFPYKESSRRAWIFRSTLGVTYMDYTHKSIYDKTNEWLTYTRFLSAIEIQQPWGSLYSSLNGILYLHDFDKNRLTISAGMEVNLFEGFSCNFDGNYSRTRDQISLSGEGESEADILLRRRELASGYNYWFSFGISYSFGSIYNNIVNPRF
ncbi:MAG: hypothetical protein DWP97_12440 [Calditrichaeota bacterium]|nr:MAG: hypothetical protein DWP97_12440 [Calditrichota bacterium]